MVTCYYVRLRICCSRHTLRLNNKLRYTHPSVAKFALPVLDLPEGDRFANFPRSSASNVGAYLWFFFSKKFRQNRCVRTASYFGLEWEVFILPSKVTGSRLAVSCRIFPIEFHLANRRRISVATCPNRTLSFET